MRVENWIAVAFSLMVAAVAMAQTPQQIDQPTESEHHAGPHGLEGWTLSKPFSGAYSADPLPFEVVIARGVKVVRKIEGKPFVWRWIFWKDGREVAYEAGPLHWAMQCNLMDMATGRTLDSIDCFHELPKNAPAWAKTLEAEPQ